MSQIINKKSPFDIGFIKPEHSYFSHLLAHAISQLDELPDFSDDGKIAIMSDFSGESNGKFRTYSFLILAYNKIGPFSTAVSELRKEHGIEDPYSEFVFKDLNYGPRKRALPKFLDLVDNFIHGAVITLAVDKEIGTVFGENTNETHAHIVKHLADGGYGKWSGQDAEKVMRVCHLIAIFSALLTKDKQSLLWYCDNDTINSGINNRSFSDTQKIFNNTLSLYCSHSFHILGFAKPFEDSSHLDDLLSISDFAAGITQDLLQSHKTGIDEIPGRDGEGGKVELLKWIARKSRYLSKITIQISKLPNGEIGSGVVTFTPAT